MEESLYDKAIWETDEDLMQRYHNLFPSKSIPDQGANSLESN